MGRWANMYDTLQNLVTGLGMQGIDSSVAGQYILNLLDRNTLENMYRADWLARKIIDAPAEDMTREWRAWQASQKQIEALEEVEKTLDLQRKVKQWIIKARLYGGSALVIGVDDGQDPSQPIDLKKCKTGCLKYVVVLHRYELNAGPRIYNVMDPYYTRAAYYTVATPMFGFEGEQGVTQPTVAGQRPSAPVPGATQGFWNNVIPFGKKNNNSYYNTIPTNIGLTQIHPSRVLELAGHELPDWRLAPLGGGWGDSILQTVVDDMQSFTTTVRSIAAMVSDGKLDVVKIPDMALNLTNANYKNKMIERFALSAQTKSVISALLLDKEEDWQRVNTQYGGLPMIMHEFITFISGASGIPVSRLFGQAAGRGLSGGSTGGGGEEDLRNYYDNCATEQKNEVAPRLGMLDQILMRSALGKDDPNVHYEWNPLWQMSDAEKAAIAYQKAQATQIYASIGVINEDAFREGVVNQLIEDGTYPGLDDAIEEFGSEPEEPEDTGGYQQPGKPGGGKPPDGKPSPNAEETGHSGGMDAVFDFDPNEPRDPRGKWTSGGGFGELSGLNHPGHGYSKEAYQDAQGVIHTTKVEDAARALYEKKKVELNQPDEVSTLIQHLGKVAARMAKITGEKPPVFNLCNASVKGTNLFCAESKGIERVKMPQLTDDQTRDFVTHMSGKYGVDNTSEFASHLRATQDELNGAKVASAMNLIKTVPAYAARRIVVSNDNYILDGHHTWAGHLAIDAADGVLDNDKKMNITRVNIPIIKLLEEAETFTGGKGKKGVGDRRR